MPEVENFQSAPARQPATSEGRSLPRLAKPAGRGAPTRIQWWRNLNSAGFCIVSDGVIPSGAVFQAERGISRMQSRCAGDPSARR